MSIPIWKDKKDIQRFEEAGHIVWLVHERLKEMIKPGVSLKELNDEAFRIIKENDAEPSFLGYGGFPDSICASVNDVILHGFATDYILKEGDLVSIDVGAFKDGVHGDAAFTKGVGVISEETDKLQQATKIALERAIALVKPGITTGDIGHSIETTAEELGFFVTKEYVGHGVGENLHEDPSVPCYGTPGTGTTLKEGMVIAIEPMFLIGTESTKVDSDNWTVRSVNGKYTSHDEHTIYVTSNGAKILTKERRK